MHLINDNYTGVEREKFIDNGDSNVQSESELSMTMLSIIKPKANGFVY